MARLSQAQRADLRNKRRREAYLHMGRRIELLKSLENDPKETLTRQDRLLIQSKIAFLTSVREATVRNLDRSLGESPKVFLENSFK